MNFLSRTKSALQPLLSEVSTRTAELRDFESAINAKKQELERVSKKLEEVSSTLRCESLVFFVIYKSLFIFSPLILSTYIFSDLDNKSTLIGGNSPALLALLAGAYLYILKIETTLYCVVYKVYSVLCLSSHVEEKTVFALSNISNAGSLIFNLAAGSQLASSFLAEKVQNLSIPMFVICGFVLISYIVVNLLTWVFF